MVCFHCVEEDLCPECGKLKRFVQRGYSGAQPPRLVEPLAPKRSVTMELMIERLQRQVLSEDAPSVRPEAALKLPRKLIDKEARAGQKRPLKRRSVKTRRPMSYGFLMPSVAPLVRVSRSPISRMALLMLVAFSLGTFFARQGSVSATVPPAESSQALGAGSAIAKASEPSANVEVQYKPVYIHVPLRQAQPLASTPRAGMPTPPPASRAPAALPHENAALPHENAALPRENAALAPVAKPEATRAMGYPIASRQKFAPVSEEPPVPQPAAPAKLEVAFPHPGNIVRSTSIIRVRVENPGKLALLNLAVDGTPVKAIPQIAESLEIPLDTAAFKNGDHTLQILAMENDGAVISSQAIPITIRN